MRHPQRIVGRAVTVTVVTALAATALGGPALADTPELVIEDGATRPAFDYADAVYQEVDIRTEADSDGDGEPDTVRMRLMRPRETDEGLRVPTIIEPSPYWGGGNEVEMYDVDLDDDSAGTVPRRGGRPTAPGTSLAHQRDAAALSGAGAPEGTLGGYYDNYFLPRGYAVAQIDSLGTGDSTGCPTSGGHNESLGVKAAVDWLNGRAPGWDPEGNRVSAKDWSTGKAAMTGISYNGTLPIAAASTGVEGLETIVPQAAISSWYDYYRGNGGVVAPGGFQGEDTDVLAEYVYTRDDRQVCRSVIDRITKRQDRESGDYTRFWHERNYRDDVADMRTSVFLVHGVNDWNVKTEQAARLWTQLEKHDVPRKLWLHQAGHTNPLNLRMDEWLRQLHGWFDHWLHGLDNGIMDEPAVDVENADFSWSTQEDWPAEGTRSVRLRMTADPDSATGDLVPRRSSGKGVRETFRDAGRTVKADELVSDPDRAGENALVYRTGELERDVRVNGIPEVSVRAAMDGASPYLTALLVDYGTDTRATSDVWYDRDNKVCYGEGVPEDTGCTFPSYHETETSDFKIVSRGWLDARNRYSDWWQRPVVTDRTYRFSWDMQAQDYVFKAGHRLGIVLISTDYDYTLRYPAGTEVTLDTGHAVVDLPISTGRSALND